jgi:tetratricopeptide (TPR) repeat protein
LISAKGILIPEFYQTKVDQEVEQPVGIFFPSVTMWRQISNGFMYRSSSCLIAAMVGTTVACGQPVTAANSASEIKSVAQAVVVEIQLQQNEGTGSGVIIDRAADPEGNRQGDLYTVVTNRHVVCGNQPCSELPTGQSYSLGLIDGQRYQVNSSSVKLLGQELDLAIIQFRSNRNYIVAKLAAPGSLKNKDDVYTSGFPLEKTGFAFRKGEAVAVVNKRLIDDAGGYTVIYNASTLPGMSGGGVFDRNGQLVAIHGRGDRYKDNTLPNEEYRVNSKIGYNRGVPVHWLVQGLAEIGIKLRGQTTSTTKPTPLQASVSADEHFIAGFNKFVDPGDNVEAGKRQAIQEFGKAIQLNPKYDNAYFVRAMIFGQLKDYQLSLSDYNQAISINPGFFVAYNNRAVLRYESFNDIQGALTDYNQAITISPRKSEIYSNRAILKADKLKDDKGALDDYNQSILLNPTYVLAYYNRANLKKDKLNDYQGALADYNQTILLNPKIFLAYNNRAALKHEKLNDPQGALVDYNQTIIVNPKHAGAYYNRALLKKNKLNDPTGALADYNQAIIINPKYTEAYNNRALLKHQRLNDDKGALLDYNQAIMINPKYAEAYYNRAFLKNNTLNDVDGAIQDLRRAKQLFKEEGNVQSYQLVIRTLRQFGVAE